MLTLTANARNIYITPDADGTGDGSSWESPMMLTNYLKTAKLKNGDIVRLKSGHYTAKIETVTFGNYQTIKVSGGYAGTDDNTLDPDFPYSDIDFANYPSGYSGSPLLCKAIANYSLTLERLHMRRASSAVFFKQNAGILSLTDCHVISNGWRNYASTSCNGGRGIHSDGGSLYMTNCVIAYNGMYAYPSGSASTYGDHGFGVFLKNNNAEIVGCKFFGNGSRINQNAADAAVYITRGGGRGMALYATGATALKVIGCDFICNKSLMGYYNATSDKGRGRGAGGTVVLDAVTTTGALFKNCSWIANMNVNCHNYGGMNNDFGGALNINLSSPSSVVNVDNCTFAYNVTDSPKASPGLEVWKGIVNVSNSLFVGNHKLDTCVAGADIMVRTGAVANVSYTLLGGNDDYYVNVEEIGEDKGAVNLSNVIIGEAILGSDTLSSTNLIEKFTKKTSNTSITLPCFRYKVSKIDEVLAFDVHARSKGGRWTADGFLKDKIHSPSIDAGDPEAPYGSEPKPHGRRLNLGRYGGTEEASRSRPTGLRVMIR